jgi:hypothetical protein
MIKKIQPGTTAKRTDRKRAEKRASKPGKHHQLNKLKEAQERAHQKSAFLNGPAVYQYERGPDGKTYIVDATATIDTSPVPGDPEATIRKMQSIQQGGRAISEGAVQQAVKAAEQAEEAARLELTNFGLVEPEAPVWGDTSAPRLDKTLESTSRESAEDGQEPKGEGKSGGLSAPKAGHGSRALNAYRGVGAVVTATSQQLHPFGVKAK